MFGSLKKEFHIDINVLTIIIKIILEKRYVFVLLLKKMKIFKITSSLF